MTEKPPDLPPELIRAILEECHLAFNDTGERAHGYDWMLEELCRIALEGKKVMTPQQNVHDVGNDWSRRWISGTFPMHRTGWSGLWDAFKAAITRTPRRTVPTELTFSVYTKPGENKDVLLSWGGQLSEEALNHD
jgi:hypothetical protein